MITTEREGLCWKCPPMSRVQNPVKRTKAMGHLLRDECCCLRASCLRTQDGDRIWHGMAWHEKRTLVDMHTYGWFRPYTIFFSGCTSTKNLLNSSGLKQVSRKIFERKITFGCIIFHTTFARENGGRWSSVTRETQKRGHGEDMGPKGSNNPPVPKKVVSMPKSREYDNMSRILQGISD